MGEPAGLDNDGPVAAQRLNAGPVWAGGVAAAGALLATGLLHVLLLETPRPLSFFTWIAALADLILVVAPFSQPATLPSKVFTAVINLVAGVAVISLLTGVARGAMQPGSPRPVPGPSVTPDPRRAPGDRPPG